MTATNDPLIVRYAAVQATVDRYNGKPLELGKRDCARMGAHLLKGLGIKVAVSKFGSYSTPMGARRALERQGTRDLVEAVDRLGLQRIAPAAALQGDLLALPAPDDQVALFIALETGRGFGSLGGVFQPADVHLTVAAWRTI